MSFTRCCALLISTKKVAFQRCYELKKRQWWVLEGGARSVEKRRDTTLGRKKNAGIEQVGSVGIIMISVRVHKSLDNRCSVP